MSLEKEENDMGIYKRRDNINLTEQEYEIYLFLIKYFKENGYAPTVREIGKGVYLSSTATIKYYLDALERKKKIKRGSSANVQAFSGKFLHISAHQTKVLTAYPTRSHLSVLPHKHH